MKFPGAVSRPWWENRAAVNPPWRRCSPAAAMARTDRITLGGVPLAELDEAGLAGAVTYFSHNSYLFKGTVRDNLWMAAPDADDAALWAVLEQVRLADFLRAEQGLDTRFSRKPPTFGRAVPAAGPARALLHDSPVYLFDEATSNIDVESENDSWR